MLPVSSKLRSIPLFLEKPNFSKLKRLIKTDQEIALLKKAMVLGRVGFEKFAKYLQKNSNKDEKYLEVRGLVTEAKMLKVISKRKGSYYFMSNKLGLDIEEVVSELLDDDKLYSMVIEKVNAKKKAK